MRVNQTVALVVLAAHLCACARAWQPAELHPDAWLGRANVVTISGERVALKHARVEGDRLVGRTLSDDVQWSAPVHSVAHAERYRAPEREVGRRSSTGRILIGVGILVAIGVTAFGIWLNEQMKDFW